MTTTPLTNDEVISMLNVLIETCKNGEYGFSTAAEGVKTENLKSLFNQFSRQRAGYAGDLRGEVRRLGGDPEKSGTILGSIHRGWIDIKSLVTGADEDAILAECERGEDYAVQAYEDALQNQLSVETRTLVQMQYNGVKSAHDEIRGMEKVSSVAN